MRALEPRRPDSGLLVLGSRTSHRLQVNNSHRFQDSNQSSKTSCLYIRLTIGWEESWLKTVAGLLTLHYMLLKKLCLLPDLGSVSFYLKVDPTKSGSVSKAAYRLPAERANQSVRFGQTWILGYANGRNWQVFRSSDPRVGDEVPPPPATSRPVLSPSLPLCGSQEKKVLHVLQVLITRRPPPPAPNPPCLPV